MRISDCKTSTKPHPSGLGRRVLSKQRFWEYLRASSIGTRAARAPTHSGDIIGLLLRLVNICLPFWDTDNPVSLYVTKSCKYNIEISITIEVCEFIRQFYEAQKKFVLCFNSKTYLCV